MCGLIGVASSNGVQSRDWLVAGRDAMRHRGPDDAGLWWSQDGRVGLAHRRLSIIDLSAAGHQPMADVSGRCVIAFNGEIYNFTALREELLAAGLPFATGSDTEVILNAYRAWGDECLSRLQGMFAFALYDREQGRVLLARDRAGEKPLYYRHQGQELRFASELKGMLADPSIDRVIDAASLDCYLYMGYVPGDRCILQGFNKLPAAHAMSFDVASGECKVWRYWSLPEYEAHAGGASEAELLNELEVLLEKAVRRQMVADVPVGVLLSGGVDSSVITAMAARANSRVKTFTIMFPGHGKYDETEHARLVARHFGTEHIELEACATTADLLPQLARQFDEPMVDSSMVPTFLVSQLVRQHCTVALGGDGGDELFGGYGYYSRLLKLQRDVAWVPLSLRKLGAMAAARMLPLGFGGNNIRSWLLAMGTDMQNGLPLIASYFDASVRRGLVRGQQDWPLVAESVHAGAVPQNPELLQRATRMDFRHYLAEDILVKVDRTSMLHSLEVRAPMLDVEVVEFAARKVPTSMKSTFGEKKVLLKHLANRLLPPEFDRHRKQGFSIPLKSWLQQGPFRELFQSVLHGQDTLFDERATSELMRGQDAGRSNEERLFSLVMFELWRREYGVRL
jgi:asparagine synthase (glutamine-hydrolysing)